MSYGMRGTAPIHPAFGSGKGTPIDRHYIDRFLNDNRESIAGAVLEVGDRTYTERFGSGVERSDVLNVVPSNAATFVGDLTSCPEIPDETYDCVILTQVLHCIYDMKAVVAETHRILKPGGTLLCTAPGISQVSRFDMDRWGDRWRLTSQSASELMQTRFRADDTKVATYGNAYAAVCFLQGVPLERTSLRKIARYEPDYQIIIGVSATRPGKADATSRHTDALASHGVT